MIMGDPHRKERYGEVWDPDRNQLMLAVIGSISPYIVISGGWAWHFLSPPGHTDYKHAHDHKDLDIFVKPEYVAECVQTLKQLSFQKVSTKYDLLPSSKDFRRYERYQDVSPEKAVKLTIDFFVNDVPSRELPTSELGDKTRSVKVVDPATLLTYYGRTNASHSSDKCWAVNAARKLIAAGEDVLHHPELVAMPT